VLAWRDRTAGTLDPESDCPAVIGNKNDIFAKSFAVSIIRLQSSKKVLKPSNFFQNT
jgi:hypothetical protein